MEEVLVLLAIIVCLAIFLRRSATRRRAQKTIHQIVDAATAHLAFNEKASAFLNRPAAIFPVVLAVGLRGERNDNVTTVDYGPQWRALRCNLTAKIFHPSRVASLAPIQRDATKALVADMSARVRDGAAVTIRDAINAVFGMVERQCVRTTRATLVSLFSQWTHAHAAHNHSGGSKLSG